MTHWRVDPNTPSWVYRIYDADGTALYIGVSCQPEKRIADHRRLSYAFRDDMASVRYRAYPNRTLAEAAEREAIAAEWPLYNNLHVPGSATPEHYDWKVGLARWKAGRTPRAAAAPALGRITGR